MRSLTFEPNHQTCFPPNSQELFMKGQTPPPRSQVVKEQRAVGPNHSDSLKGTHLFSSAMSRAVQGTPRVIKEMLLMAGLTNARHVVTADRTQTTALNLPLNWREQTKSISKGGLGCRVLQGTGTAGGSTSKNDSHSLAWSFHF